MPVSAPIKIECRWADGRLEWLPELAADMVRKSGTATALEQLGWKRQPQSWDGKRYWAKVLTSRDVRARRFTRQCAKIGIRR